MNETPRVIDVDVNEILPGRFQPRITFNEEEILELTDSIKEHGIIQPIVVRSIGDKYEIIAGERRYKASVLAGKETVPVIVKNLNDKDSAEIALIENVQRRNLTPIEEALSYKRILDMEYITQENLANKLGKSQSAIANKIRLLNLTDEVQEALLDNKISERHARSLLRISSKEEQNNMLKRIIDERLTVRRTDEEINKLLSSERSELSDSQDIIRKEDINMNDNNINMVPNQQPGVPSFDAFSVPQAPVPTLSAVEQPSAGPQNFDIFAGNSTPAVDMQGMNTMVPPVEQPVSNGYSFDINGNVMAAPTPTPAPVPPVEQPSAGPQNFDIFAGNSTPAVDMQGMNTMVSPVEQPPVMSQPVEQPSSEVPFVAPQPQMSQNMPNMVNNDINNTPAINPEPLNYQNNTFNMDIFNQPNLMAQQPSPDLNINSANQQEIPTTAPILESTPVQPAETQINVNTNGVTQESEDLFSFSAPTPAPVPPVEQQQISEQKVEPIIVTDYTKQYDPVMPQNNAPTIEKADFKEVINAIRDCSKKIEQYGYKIELDEYDLANIYQVVVKIEK